MFEHARKWIGWCKIRDGDGYEGILGWSVGNGRRRRIRKRGKVLVGGLKSMNVAKLVVQSVYLT